MEHYLEKLALLQVRLNQALLGKSEVVELVLTCLLAGGHLLLEDLPGVGKTTLGMALAQGISGDFSRVQFTSDLLPSDILGARIYRRKLEQFEFVPGPIFAHLVLADELNRAPPKTQSALLQAMNEECVTIDRDTHPLPSPFMVIATQNPRGYQGTYPLPESQRDRFLMRLSIGFPEPEIEEQILREQRNKLPKVEAVLSPDEVLHLRKLVGEVEVPSVVINYVARLAAFIRKREDVNIPVSPRATLALMRACQALAFCRRLPRVDFDVVKFMVPFVFAHRLNLKLQTAVGVREGATHSWMEEELLRQVSVD